MATVLEIVEQFLPWNVPLWETEGVVGGADSGAPSRRSRPARHQSALRPELSERTGPAELVIRPLCPPPALPSNTRLVVPSWTDEL